MSVTISGTSGITTPDIASSAYQGGQLAGLRNKIINGNFDIWQRGTTAVTTNAYSTDRWYTTSTGNSHSVTQGTFASGDTLYDNGSAKYFTQIAVTSVANAANNTVFRQPIEYVRTLANSTVTVSFWAKAASGTPSIGVELSQYFGSTGSAQVNISGQAQALSTTWTKYTKTFTVPSLNGKTISGGDDALYLTFWLDAGSNYDSRTGSIGQSSKTVSIAQVQVEISSVATLFEQRPYGLELALCQRYLPCWDFDSSGGGYQTVAVGLATAANACRGHLFFQVTPRVIPTGIVQSGSFVGITSAYGVGSAGTLTLGAYSTKNSLALALGGTSGLTQGDCTFIACAGVGQIQATGCEL